MKLEELTLLLKDAGLEDYLDTAAAWCEQEGASFAHELLENVNSFAEGLDLKRAEKTRLVETFRKKSASVGAAALSPQATLCPFVQVQVDGCEVLLPSQQRRAQGDPSSGGCVVAQRRGILCFGDSLTEGYCVEAEANWLPLGPLQKRVFRPYSDHLERRLIEAGWQPLVINRGCSGERTDSMLQRLPRVLKELSADVVEVNAVLILAGTNDLATSGAAEIFARLAQLHETAWREGIRTGILTVPELRLGETHYARLSTSLQSRRLELNSLLHDFANQNAHRAIFVDVAASFPQDGAHADLWDKDGVHFTSKGYAALGEFIAETMWQGAVAF